MRNRVDEFIADPKKALYKLAWPMLIAMLVQTLYNVVDTAFVGRLGADSIAALTFSFPLFFILIGLNSGIAVGMSSRISRFMGEKNKKGAENTAMHGILLGIFFFTISVVLGLIFIRPMFNLFGATPAVIELAVSYFSIVLMGSVFMFTAYIMNNIFVSQGDTKTPMKVQVFTLLLNIILDPIFIYVLGYGVKGAAIATVISFSVGFILYSYFLHKKSYLHIHPQNFTFSTKLIKEILMVGFPASLMMIVMSIFLMIFNWFMANFGTEYVAAFGIGFRAESVVIMPVMAGSFAVMTLVGMFFGAKRVDLIKGVVWYGIKAGLLYTLIVGGIFFAFPSLIYKIFTSDPTLLKIGVPYLRVIVFAYPFMGITMIIGRTLQGMGYGVPGLVINLLRTILISTPLSYLFVFVFGFGYLSVVVSIVIAAVIASVVAVVWFEWEIKKAIV
ncbi:MATE family efflux transporter [Candidatus Woesearchaeota archaeon]|jgi:putative MATE family efflux protein|nr:MATE family efflux transporter [Candidatus Woesearchaeota archaeon]